MSDITHRRRIGIMCLERGNVRIECDNVGTKEALEWAEEIIASKRRELELARAVVANTAKEGE